MDDRFEQRRKALRAEKLAEQLALDLQASINRAAQHGQPASWMEQRTLNVLNLLRETRKGA